MAISSVSADICAVKPNKGLLKPRELLYTNFRLRS